MIITGQNSKSAVQQLFREAPLDQSKWIEALGAMAQETGSNRGQLVGFSQDGSTSFNFITEVDDAFLRAFNAISYAPDQNFRVAATGSYASGTVLHEAHYAAEIARTGETEYEETCDRLGLSFGCQVELVRDSGALVGMALLRARREKPTTPTQRAFFKSIIPHAAAAVRLQRALDGRGLDLLQGSLDAVGAAALLIDGFGRVVGMTPAADRILVERRFLDVRRGSLVAGRSSANRALHAAVGRALSGSPEEVVDLQDGGIQLLTVRIQPLPTREWDMGYQPRAIAILEEGQADGLGLRSAFSRQFGLTAAEVEIACLLASGTARSRIAEHRSTSIGTVRQQVKAIFAKLGVSREAEFMLLTSGIEKQTSA